MTASERGRTAAWFIAWMVAGAALALGSISVIGVIVLPAALALVAVLATRRGARGGLPGLVSGLGIPLLYVAWLNREGPGNICHAIENGESCTEQWSPWPWLAVGSLLVAIGIVVAVVRERRRLATG